MDVVSLLVLVLFLFLFLGFLVWLWRRRNKQNIDFHQERLEGKGLPSWEEMQEINNNKQS